jgi:hypothetical protein
VWHGLVTRKHQKNLDCGIGTQEGVAWVGHTQTPKRSSTAGWARRRVWRGIVTRKHQKESRLRDRHAGGCGVGWSHADTKKKLDCGIGTQEGVAWVGHTQTPKRISTAG